MFQAKFVYENVGLTE